MADAEEETTVPENQPSTSKKKKGGKKKGKKKAGTGKRNKKKQPKGSIVWMIPRKPPIGPSYSPCPHIYFKHSVVDRKKLDQKKYDSFLATPKGEPWIEPPEEPQMFRRRLLTPRTECLAMPPKRKMAAQLKEFSGILTPRMTENLGALLETDCDLTASDVKVLLCKPFKPEKKGVCFPGLEGSREWIGNRIAGLLAEFIKKPPRGAKTKEIDAIAGAVAKRLKKAVGDPEDPKQKKKVDKIIKNLSRNIASMATAGSSSKEKESTESAAESPEKSKA